MSLAIRAGLDLAAKRDQWIGIDADVGCRDHATTGCRRCSTTSAPLLLIALTLFAAALLLVGCARIEKANDQGTGDSGGSNQLDAAVMPDGDPMGCTKLWTVRRNADADLDTDARAYIQEGLLRLAAWNASDGSCINPVGNPGRCRTINVHQ